MTRHAVVADTVLSLAGPQAEAIVIDGDRIAGFATVGELGDLPVARFPGTTIVPPLVDSHIHPVGYAALLGGVSLMNVPDMADLIEIVRHSASLIPPGQALVAQRLDDNELGRLPTSADLDLATSERPVLVYRYCGHIAVANTAALDLAGIGPATDDPPGGSLDRDDRGVPTGVLRETAIDLVARAVDPMIPPPTPQSVLSAMNSLAATGLSRIGAMAATGSPIWCGVGKELELLCEVAADLPIDVDVIVIAPTIAELDDAYRRITAAGGRLRFHGWKGFADGSLGGHTASMWSPFTGTNNTGTMRLDPLHARTMARRSLQLDGIAAIHAIGDRAIDVTLDVFDELRSEGFEAGRMRVEHVSVASDSAIGRMAQSGVVASIQPAFLTSEADWVPKRLGPERAAYRFSTMAEAGVSMIGGSDCPVERPDPLAGLAAAIHRPGWNDNENLSPTDALGLFCPDPITIGSRADFVVVNGDLDGESPTVAAVYKAGLSTSYAATPWPG